MYGIARNSLFRLLPVARTNITQRTVVSAPPKNQISFTEKISLGGGMCLLILTPMLYILANVKHYKNPN